MKDYSHGSRLFPVICGIVLQLVENLFSGSNGCPSHHITGKYHWKTSKELKYVKKCSHFRISSKDQREIEWLASGSPAHVALEEVITSKKLLKDLEKLTEFHHTRELESYHSVMTKYVPKRKHFCCNRMVARTQLAILDHNGK